MMIGRGLQRRIWSTVLFLVIGRHERKRLESNSVSELKETESGSEQNDNNQHTKQQTARTLPTWLRCDGAADSDRVVQCVS